MRDFGFGRRHDKFESDMMEELNILVDMLKEGPINGDEKVSIIQYYVRIRILMDFE